MSRVLVSLLVLVLATDSLAQDVYFVIRSAAGTDVRVAKVSSDGSGFTVVVTGDDVSAWMNALIPGATGTQFTGEYFVDSVNRALYLVGRYQDATLGTLPAILRSNLDGTFMELVTAPAPPSVSNGDVVTSPQVLQPFSFGEDSDDCVGQRLDDPGFEAGGEGWQQIWSNGGRSVVGTTFHSGARSLQMLVHDTWAREVYQDVAVAAGTSYEAGVWVQTEELNGAGVTVSLVWLDVTGLDWNIAGHVVGTDEVGSITGTNDWTLLSGSFTAPTGAVVVRFELVTGNEPDEVGRAWFDDAALCDNVDDVCDAAAGGAPGDSCVTTLAGVCADGVLQCNFDELRCVPIVGPTLETCDSLDNDCNGQTDEGVCPNGEPCSSGAICSSSFCVAGFCCDLSCGCGNCDVPGSEGTCVPVPAGEDPHDACPGTDFCIAGGVCCLKGNAFCGIDSQCCSGDCSSSNRGRCR